jgi:hypothetical protein
MVVVDDVVIIGIRRLSIKMFPIFENPAVIKGGSKTTGPKDNELL